MKKIGFWEAKPVPNVGQILLWDLQLQKCFASLFATPGRILGQNHLVVQGSMQHPVLLPTTPGSKS